MTCPHCGAPNRDDARFCGKCGAATSSTEPASSANLGEAPAMIGREIAGRYRMLAKLGEGGMGAVFRAEQISLKRTVAVKLLRPDVLGNQLLLRRFNAEAELVAKLNHPNTVNIYDFGQDSDGSLFIAMEFIEGQSLRTLIQREAPLPPRRALAIASQVAASLADAHAHGIVHRDLKPDNVMLQDRGRTRDVARVLDFGIAKLRDDTRATQMQMTQQGDMLGTPQYMAPEQIRAEAIDGRTDVYAMGCLLYEMVTGRLPYEAPTVLALLSKHLLEHPVPPSQRRPDLGLPGAIDQLILGAMAKDPNARPATMEILGEQIAVLLQTLPPDPHGPRVERSGAAPAMGPAPATGGYPGTRADTPAALGGYPPPAGPQITPQPYGPGPQPTPQPYGGPQPTPPPYGPGAQGLPPPYGSGPPAQGDYRPPYNPYPPGAPPPPQAQPPVPGRSPSRKVAGLVLAGVVAVGAAVTAAVIGQRSSGGTPAPAPGPSDAGVADAREPATPDPWAGAAPSAPDPWASTAPDGTKVAVGQGVELIIPPGYQTSVQNGLTAALDSRGVVIAARAIDVATNDPRELAQAHAKSSGLVFETMQHVVVGGQRRPMALFRGKLGTVPIRRIVVPLIGPSYRIAVIFQAPSQLMASDPSVTAAMSDLYARRVVLP